MNIVELLDKVLKNNGFTEKRTYVVNNYYKLYRANLGEEKYIFSICDGSARFLLQDIISINEEAKKVDCSKVVIINQMKTPYSENFQSKIKEYGMELWELDKLVTMLESNKTCNTSKKTKKKSGVYLDSYNTIKYNSEKKTVLNTVMKKYIFPIIIVLSILGVAGGYYLQEFGKTVNSIPFGFVLFCISVILPFLSSAIYFLTKSKKMGNNKIVSIFYGIFISIYVFIFLNIGYSGIVDLINGPKEVIINSAHIEEKRSSDKYRRKQYFITGESSNNEKKSIQIRNTDKEEISAKLKKNKTIKVYYFENLNIVYELDYLK